MVSIRFNRNNLQIVQVNMTKFEFKHLNNKSKQ